MNCISSESDNFHGKKTNLRCLSAQHMIRLSEYKIWQKIPQKNSTQGRYYY